MAPKNARLLISNATIVSMNSDLGVLERCDLLFEGDRIARVRSDKARLF